MINGVHLLIYTKAADEVRAFIRDILGFGAIDAGEGWLIFGLPPAELGIHPTDTASSTELYLMCDDVEKTVQELKARGVEFAREIEDQGYGLVTAIKLPGGSELGLYQPRHPTVI